MRTLARLRPSPAMAVALLALFVAMGGVSYAVATIDSSDIVNGSIKSRDVKNGTLTKADVKGRSLSGRNIGTATVDSRNLRTGAVRSIDILNGTIGTNDVDNGSLNTLDLANGSVFGLDVNNNSLTGLDINEATLGQVNSAANAATVSTVRTIPLTTRDESGGDAGACHLRAVLDPRRVHQPTAPTRTCTSVSTPARTTAACTAHEEADADFDAAQGALAMVSAADIPGGIPTATGPDGYFNAFAPSGAALTGHWRAGSTPPPERPASASSTGASWSRAELSDPAR